MFRLDRREAGEDTVSSSVDESRFAEVAALEGELEPRAGLLPGSGRRLASLTANQVAPAENTDKSWGPPRSMARL